MNTCKQCGTENEIPWNWAASDLCPACAHLAAKKPSSILHPPSSTAEFRTLKATVPAIEFGVVQWAAKRAGAGRTSQALDVFLRLAVLERVRAVVKAEIARGKPIPPDIAAVLDQTRAKMED
jgi:hypothetical protein